MTTPTVPPPARRGKRGILSAAFRFKLGGISKSTFHRLERTDPRFPRPGRLRNQKIWDEGVADDYVELVISDPDREEAVAATNGERSRHIAEPEPDTERNLEPPRRGRPPGSKNKRKEAAAAAGAD